MQWLTFVFVELQIPARALLPSRSVRERGLQSLLLCRYPCNYLRACYIEQLHFRNMRRCLSAYRYLHFGRGLIFLFLVVLYRMAKSCSMSCALLSNSILKLSSSKLVLGSEHSFASALKRMAKCFR